MQTHEELDGFKVVLDLPVLWGDMDAFQHVNNVHSFRWFESGRINYIEVSPLSDQLLQGKISPILASVSCNYKRQITYPDRILLGTRVVRVGRSSMTMEHRVVSQSQSLLAADGQSVVVAFDYERQRPLRISGEVRAAIEEFENREFPAKVE